MKKAVFAGSLALIILVGPLPAAPQKMTFQEAKSKAVELHASLIGSASPAVKARITAAAQAARSYLAKCGARCDLETFLSADLKRRFSRVRPDELQVLETLSFAETVSDMSQINMLDLQNAMQKQAQLIQVISNIAKTTHDTLKSIIQNMR
jgi:hypothetical protein